MTEDPRLYDLARSITHAIGAPWTDPRTLVTHPPPGTKPEIEPLTADELEYLEQRARNEFDRVRPVHVLSLVAEVRRLRAQLPAEMQHCTILFRECSVGHGRLTAANWIDHGCSTCEIQRLRSDEWLESAADELNGYIEQWDGPYEGGHDRLEDRGDSDWLFRAVLWVLRKQREVSCERS